MRNYPEVIPVITGIKVGLQLNLVLIIAIYFLVLPLP